jgi:hypothetical protein
VTDPNELYIDSRLRPKFFSNNLTRAHVGFFVGMFTVFTILTFCIALADALDGPNSGAPVWQATLGTIAGPMNTALSKGCPKICQKFSLGLIPDCAPLLVIAILVPFIRLPECLPAEVIRPVFWILGWLVWFFCGLIASLCVGICSMG